LLAPRLCVVYGGAGSEGVFNALLEATLGVGVSGLILLRRSTESGPVFLGRLPSRAALTGIVVAGLASIGRLTRGFRWGWGLKEVIPTSLEPRDYLP
jgi:hypothetical protein